jgi:hypothetical protein
MRYHEINSKMPVVPAKILIERTVDNINLLRDCVDLVITNLPRKFSKNKRYVKHGLTRGHAELVKKYAQSRYFGIIKKIFPDLTIATRNETASANSTTLGSYTPGLIILNVSGFMRSAEAVTLDEVLAHRNKQESFKAVILHELRHLFQSYLYMEYYRSTIGRNYREDPTEIDAAWMHHLEDRPVDQFPDAVSYAKAVMSSFTEYKDLTPQWQTHYFRKTVRYYIDAVSSSPSANPPAKNTRIP